MMDLSQTIQPNSDQLDSVELVAPRTFTIERVSKGNAEQPVNIHFVDFPRPWRPGKSMRRVLVACWGPDASTYVGRSVRLFCDPDVVFGGLAVGGTRIAALSDIDKPKKVPLLISRGKSAIFVVQPLKEAAQETAKPATNALTATEYRDKALAAQGELEPLRALFAEVKAHHLDGAEVIDDTGETVALGDLIRRLGEEARK